jgi:hypothetical protein
MMSLTNTSYAGPHPKHDSNRHDEQFAVNARVVNFEPGKYIQIRVHLQPVAYNAATTGTPASSPLVPYRIQSHS